MNDILIQKEDVEDQCFLYANGKGRSHWAIFQEPCPGAAFLHFLVDLRPFHVIKNEGNIVQIVGDFVCEKFVKTKRGDLMKFGTFLDCDGRFFDTVHFPQSLAKFPLRGAGLYLIEGKVILEYGCPSIEVIRCGKMPLKPDPRSE